MGFALYKARIEAGLSQKELAAKAGGQATNISNTESGKRRISVGKFTEYMAALGKNVGFYVEDMADEN